MDFDRLKGAFAALTKSVMSRVDFFALYPCKVLKQNADGTLELQPEVSRLPGFSQVPIRYTIPGMKVTIQSKDLSGCRACVGFEDGDPRRPYATLFIGTDFTTLELGKNPADYLVRGTAYRAAEKQLHQNLSTGLSTLAASTTAIATSLGTAGAPPINATSLTLGAYLSVTLAPLFTAVATNATALSTLLSAWETAAGSPANNDFLSRSTKST